MNGAGSTLGSGSPTRSPGSSYGKGLYLLSHSGPGCCQKAVLLQEQPLI